MPISLEQKIAKNMSFHWVWEKTKKKRIKGEEGKEKGHEGRQKEKGKREG